MRYKTTTVWIVAISCLGIYVFIGTAFQDEFVIAKLSFLRLLDMELTSPSNGLAGLLARAGLKNLHWFVFISVLGSATIYFTFSGLLHWYYYIRQRSEPQKWKCQPTRFLSPDDAHHEIVLGTCNMFMVSALSGVLTCYTSNGGYSTLYYDPAAYGWPYLFLSIPLLFLLEEGALYYYHRLMHSPALYKAIHKWHHRYNTPTAFSSMAMHPLEMLGFHVLFMAPAFMFPVNAVVHQLFLLYQLIYGLLNHSGVAMTSILPWQPPTIFHDDHHKYFHVNFGVNVKLFDQLHGTLRRTDRYYSEDVYGGKGREMTAAERKKDAKRPQLNVRRARNDHN